MPPICARFDRQKPIDIVCPEVDDTNRVDRRRVAQAWSVLTITCGLLHAFTQTGDAQRNRRAMDQTKCTPLDAELSLESPWPGCAVERSNLRDWRRLTSGKCESRVSNCDQTPDRHKFEPFKWGLYIRNPSPLRAREAADSALDLKRLWNRVCWAAQLLSFRPIRDIAKRLSTIEH